MSVAIIWITVGATLILFELATTSIIAVTLGISAAIVGVTVHLDVIDSSNMSAQFTLFGVLSLSILLLARKKLKAVFVGFTADTSNEQLESVVDAGHRVIVASDFEKGAGRVVMNGVEWSAQSSDELKEGDVAWILSSDGILLQVGRSKP